MATLLVCIKRRFGQHPNCAARGGEALARQLEQLTEGSVVKVERFPCLGWCEEGPNVRIVGGQVFHYVAAQQLPEIVQLALMELGEDGDGNTNPDC